MALYCRASTADQSCARQERDLDAFAERSGYDVIATFKETGSGVKLDRAERRKVMALAQARQIDAVLVTELSRWGRSTTDLLATLNELEVRRVLVIALNGMAFDLATPHGRMGVSSLTALLLKTRPGSRPESTPTVRQDRLVQKSRIWRTSDHC